MKKLSIKKILIAVLWIIAIAGLTTSLGFVSQRQSTVVAGKYLITIHNAEENFFLSEQDVADYLDHSVGQIRDRKFEDFQIPMLEKVLNAHPAVKIAEVSATITGDIKIDVWQRQPVLRMINRSGESYYLDDTGKPMPLSENFSARVLLVSGEFEEPYSRRYEQSAEKIESSQLFRDVSLLDDIYRIGRTIAGDSVLTAAIHQVYINKEGEFELYPAIGNHKIIFGDANNVQEKFNKLKLFYTEGLNRSNGWHKYSAINLKYKNLVVGTRK